MIGNKLSGRYEILDRVGGGGMAVVYKAKDILLDRIVAVKVLRPQYAIDDDFVHRFRREAQAAASLSHPHIVSIYDVGVEGDTHYIIMEYVDGSTLKEYINEHAPLAVEDAVHIAKQIAEALEHAHQNHIIHRDIKPHNILIGKNNRIKVTDFGIARAVTSATITHTGSVIGSVHYFSPEQARGGTTGEKSDIYSLGIVLYEMLTGSLPFSGDSPISIALKHLQDSYTEPRQLNSSIPQSVENIILRSLAKNPMDRYSSAGELIKDLSTCLHVTRVSENKLIMDQEFDDEEATKIVPAISDDLYETKVVKARQVQEDEEDEWEYEDERPKRRWVKAAIIFTIVLLVGFGMFKGYQYVSGMFAPKEFILEDVTNLPVEEAREKLEALGLRVDTSREVFSEEVAEGHVVKQEPAAESMVREGNFIILTVSKGIEHQKMPSVTLLQKDVALNTLINHGFNRENIKEEEEFSDEAVGIVIRQEPEAEEAVVPENTQVKLVVSKGKEEFDMPNLIGKTKEEAISILESKNLPLNKIEKGLSDYPEGIVYNQYPVDPEQPVVAGTQITIWVSEGYKETTRTKNEEYVVFVKPGEEQHVTIFVTDANGSNQKVKDETIYETTGYPIQVTVTREQPATIRVYINGKEHESKTITFD